MSRKTKSVVKKTDTQTTAARERGISQQAVSKRLAKAENMAARLQAQRLRKWKAEADLLELERREKERELISLAEAQAHQMAVLSPIRQRFLSLPADMAARTNPNDPNFARKALEQWRDEALKLCREEIAKIA